MPTQTVFHVLPTIIAALAEASQDHFSGDLGFTEKREFSLLLDVLHVDPFELEALDESFLEAKIWGRSKLSPPARRRGRTSSPPSSS